MGMQVGTTSENGGVSLTTLWANRVDSTSSIAWWCFLGLSLRRWRHSRLPWSESIRWDQPWLFLGVLAEPWDRMEGSHAKPQFVAKIWGDPFQTHLFFGIPRVPSNTLFELHTFQVLMLMKHVFLFPDCRTDWEADQKWGYMISVGGNHYCDDDTVW